MQRLKIIYGLIFVLMLGFTACAQDSTKSITVDQLSQKMKTDSNLVVLDVRTPQELVGPLGKINGSINIPVQNLEKRVNELNKYKKNEIAVICRTGHRSLLGTKILEKKGFDVINVLGGMSEYRKKGH
jgi:rhodanese-related sulfurtransferase